MEKNKSAARPFLKWAGNKFRLLQHILPHLPSGNRLIEPFAGAAALTMNSEFSKYWLNDLNRDLVLVYRALKKHPRKFITHCEHYCSPKFNNKLSFYDLREQFNHSTDPFERAVLFIYLNRHGYNGLCRYNSSGIFNVPFGQYDKIYLPYKAMMNFAKRAKQVKLTHQSFEKIIKQAEIGDVIYCDPPYAPLSDTANFTQYSKQDFRWDAQEHLVELAENLQKKGISMLISNHYTDETLELYKNAEIISFEVPRFISCKGENRRKVKELLAIYQS